MSTTTWSRFWMRTFPVMEEASFSWMTSAVAGSSPQLSRARKTRDGFVMGFNLAGGAVVDKPRVNKVLRILTFTSRVARVVAGGDLRDLKDANAQFWESRFKAGQG